MKKITEEEAIKAFNERGFDIIGDYVNTQKPVLIRDKKCGHEWKTSYNSIINTGSGCPKCAGNIKITEEKARKAFDERGFDMIGDYVNTQTPVLLRDRKCGHEWKARYDSVINGGHGCTKCGGTLKITEEEAIKAFDERGFDMIGDYVNSTTAILLRDRKCGYEWKASYHSVINNGSGCPKCAGLAKITEEKARKVFDERGFNMIGDYVNTYTPVLLKDKKCGHEWYASYNNVINSCTGCPKCVGTLKITEEKARNAFDKRNFEMLGDYVNSTTPILLRDRKCGHEWKASYNNVINNGTCCPKCVGNGFNPSKPAIFYVIYNPTTNCYKIGITNIKNNNELNNSRLKKWKKLGWDICNTLKHENGGFIKDIETNTLNWLRNDLKLKPYLPPSYNGWTETVDAMLIEQETIWNKVNFFIIH